MKSASKSVGVSRWAAWALALALTGCELEAEQLPARGHHVVSIDTDAILPSALAEAPTDMTPTALFDRLELTVLLPGETEPDPERVRVYEVDAATFAEGGSSFTIEATPGEAPRVRARLFRAASVYSGEIRPEATVEVWAQLPPTPEEGPIETAIFLLTQDVGIPRGSAEAAFEVSDAPESRVRAGRIQTSIVGTWPGATPTACAGDPGPGEVCVPGGAYWMGNPLMKGDDFVEADRQRLVVLSPFFLDAKEVTVGELREFAERRPPEDVDVVRHDPDPTTEAHYCTFTEEPDTARDARPVNCLSWETAERFCEDRGGALPTEAQFEYVSGALRSALYIWGQDEAAICGAAVWGRSGRPGTAIAAAAANDWSEDCLPPEPDEDGPQPILDTNVDETRITDRVELLGGRVFDLAGNLQEWTRDWYSGQGNPCWSRPDSNIFVDPVCTDPGVLSARSVRGGSWVQDRVFLRAAYRAGRAPTQGQRFLVGFRCARSADLVP